MKWTTVHTFMCLTRGGQYVYICNKFVNCTQNWDTMIVFLPTRFICETNELVMTAWGQSHVIPVYIEPIRPPQHTKITQKFFRLFRNNSLYIKMLHSIITVWKCFYSKTNQMHQHLKFILFWNNTLRVSDRLSIHRQEFKTVHTASGTCQTEIPEMSKITSE